MIYKDICMKVHGIWGLAFVCPSVSFSMLMSAIVTNAFSSDLKTHKSQFFPMIASPGIAKLRTSPKVTIFPPPVPHYFISDQCLKVDRWTTLFLRNSIVAMDLFSLRNHETWNILRGETYASINLASTHLLLYRFNYIKLLQAQTLTKFRILFSK